MLFLITLRPLRLEAGVSMGFSRLVRELRLMGRQPTHRFVLVWFLILIRMALYGLAVPAAGIASLRWIGLL